MRSVNSICYLCSVLILILTIPLQAKDSEDVISFAEGLVLKNPNVGWDAFRPDPIEESIVLGRWNPPVEGEEVVFGDTTIQWQAIRADTAGWFSDRALRGGYLYVSVVSEEDRIMLLEEFGNDFVYVNGNPRAGNRYGYKDEWESWEPNFNFSIIPVQLKEGLNRFLFRVGRAGRFKARLVKAESVVMFNEKDPTLPDFLVGEEILTSGALVVSNNSQVPLKSYSIESQIENNNPVRTIGPIIQPMTVRKIGFELRGNAQTITGDVKVGLKLINDQNDIVASTIIKMRTRLPSETHKRTFISDIDGSVQYYAVNPARDEKSAEPKSLVLSVHGAGVEATNQAGSYNSKTWAHIVSPTNRRPYGFNWEDWGRTDALEVLDVVQNSFTIDPNRIYLTGHSMGGHGTWHLGGTFPDKFAAIGPSAGWLSFWSYRVREKIEENSDMQKMLMRPTSPSNTLAIAENYKQHGVYILHGADDDNVPAEQSRQMVKHLENFHKDFIYHEEPGQGHWWNISDEPGADCVDWPPMFDFFARHARPGKERIRKIEFITANPGISSRNNWLMIETQEEQLKLSKVSIQFDPGKIRFIGNTQNVARLSFDLAILEGKDPLTLKIDEQTLENISIPADAGRLWIEKRNDTWTVISKPLLSMKGPHRYGTFKDAFRNRFIFVYGTQGNKEENDWAYSKVRYDAEHFWYQGNGSIDVIPDKVFDPKSEPDRNIILYGNAHTNSAWKALLGDSPVQVMGGKIIVGKKTIDGDNLACLFIRPRPGSTVASVGAVSGTGITGMRLTDQRPYLSPGYGYADLTIFTPELLKNQEEGTIVAGFFGLDWKLDSGEMVWSSGSK
jgi:pimeloyl-ACP methyl ester carboxylesterase